MRIIIILSGVVCAFIKKPHRPMKDSEAKVPNVWLSVSRLPFQFSEGRVGWDYITPLQEPCARNRVRHYRISIIEFV